jgi:hypothetical protein
MFAGRYMVLHFNSMCIKNICTIDVYIVRYMRLGTKNILKNNDYDEFDYVSSTVDDGYKSVSEKYPSSRARRRITAGRYIYSGAIIILYNIVLIY